MRADLEELGNIAGTMQAVSPCVIQMAKLFSGMGFRLTSMSENEQRTIFTKRVSSSRKPRGWQPSLNLQLRSLMN